MRRGLRAGHGERERRRDRDGEWTAAAAARVVHCLREQTQRCLAGTPWVQMTLASNMNNVVTELYAVLLSAISLIRRTSPWPSSGMFR